MGRDNNYSEINALRRIQEDLMEAIASINRVLERSLPVEEARLLAQAINEKQEVYRARLHDYGRAILRCEELLAQLEEREDLLQADLLRSLEADLEDCDRAKAEAVRANRALTGWLARNLAGLKDLFSREAAT